MRVCWKTLQMNLYLLYPNKIQSRCKQCLQQCTSERQEFITSNWFIIGPFIYVIHEREEEFACELEIECR